MKTLQINCPEGYEIDLEKSNLIKGIIYFKEKINPYYTLSKELFKTGPVYFIESNGKVVKAEARLDPSAASNSTSAEQLEAILAINMLCNVAKKLNGNWKPKTKGDKYFIYSTYDKIKGRVLKVNNHVSLRQGNVYFKEQLHAYKAIEILGEELIFKILYLNSK